MELEIRGGKQAFAEAFASDLVRRSELAEKDKQACIEVCADGFARGFAHGLALISVLADADLPMNGCRRMLQDFDCNVDIEKIRARYPRVEPQDSVCSMETPSDAGPLLRACKGIAQEEHRGTGYGIHPLSVTRLD